MIGKQYSDSQLEGTERHQEDVRCSNFGFRNKENSDGE